MKEKIENYDYVMFVDASGCDGVKFDSGSSTCYAVAGYLVASKYVQDDIATLSQMRRIVSGDPNRELKYTTLRRHKKGPQALALFSQLHGRAIGRVLFKKEMIKNGSFNTEHKLFSAVAHAITITFLDYCKEVNGKKVLIVIDHMKNTEEVPVNYLAKKSMPDEMQHVESYKVIFRDSKDGDFQLIQIADFISGILRHYFEQYEVSPEMKYYASVCPLCIHMDPKRLCGKKGKVKRSRVSAMENLSYLRPIFPLQRPVDLVQRITFAPSEMTNRFFYLVCKK